MLRVLKRKAVIASLLMLILLPSIVLRTDAAETFNGYQYNEWDESVPALNGYEAVDVVRGRDAGTEEWRTPKDFYVYQDTIYLLDSGNGRVCILDDNLRRVSVIDSFTYQGAPYTLNNPSGIFVAAPDRIVIADTDNRAILVCDNLGVISLKMGKPASAIFPQEVDFKPRKVLKDQVGNYYAVVDGIYQGSVCYHPDGTFSGFFGSNQVTVNASVLFKQVWKRFMTREQIKNTGNSVPVSYNNFDIDNENFIYTSTNMVRGGANEIRKINPGGVNILPDKKYGDLRAAQYKANFYDSSFVDVCVDQNGYIYGLDQTRGRVFQYNGEGEKILIFGGKGMQEGTFLSPVAVDTLDEGGSGRVLVLDAEKASLTVFEPTEFGSLVHEALLLFNDGLYDDARQPWEKVLSFSANYHFAYISIGKSLYADGDFRGAMTYFRLGNDRENESKAFAGFRAEWIRAHFIALLIIFIVLILLLLAFPKRVRIRNRVRAKMGKPAIPQHLVVYGSRGIWNTLGHVIIHPISGFEEMKYKKKGSVPLAAGVLTAFFAVSVLTRQLTAFRFNTNRPDSLNVLYILIGTIVMILLFCIANWSICTLLDGEGRLKEIFIFTAYGLVPYIAASIVYIMMSYVMTVEMSVFMQWILLAGILWSALLIFVGLSTLHQYSISKTLASVLLSLIGLVLILFILVLVILLFQQVVLFAKTVLQEVLQRL